MNEKTTPLGGNPYRFNNPIRRRELFAGRTDELSEIRYYLDDAAGNDQPISIALIGDRAAGKTSLLNIMELEAIKRSYLTVRINLSESDIVGVTSFFERILNSLIRAIIDRTAATGPSGPNGDWEPMASAFESVISGENVDAPLDVFPFKLPRLFAKARKNDITLRLPEDVLLNDLARAQSVVGRPIVILFDECDLLTTNRAILQILRNVYMSLSGFMLVLAGTPALFEVVDAIFSPIARQFKKIRIGAFANKTEIEQCVRMPLEQSGLSAPNARRAFPDHLVAEVTNLTAGRPYEVQLICHFMYRDMQRRNGTSMRLTVDVIDDVREELGAGHNLAARPLFVTFKSYEEHDLKTLARFLAADRSITIQQLWFLEALESEALLSVADIERQWQRFAEDSVLTIIDGRVAFAGDDLDRLYLRYLARSKHIIVPAAGRSFGDSVSRVVRSLLRTFGCDPLPFPYSRFTGEDIDFDIDSALRFLHAPDSYEGPTPRPSTIIAAYEVLTSETLTDLKILSLRLDLKTPFGPVKCVAAFEAGPVASTIDDAISLLLHRLDRFDTKGVAYTSVLSFGELDEIIASLATYASEDVRSTIARHHRSRTKDLYLAGKRELAMVDAERTWLLSHAASGLNVAYVLMIAGKDDRAIAALHNVTVSNEWQKPTALYDLAVIFARRGDLKEGEEFLRLAMDAEGSNRRRCLALLIADERNGQLEWHEEFDVELTESILRTAEAIRRLRTVDDDGYRRG